MRMAKILRIAILLLPLSASQLQAAPRYAVFPQFVSGQGWSSELFLANQGLSAVPGILISFYGNNGLPLAFETNLGTADSYTADLDAGETLILKTVPSGAFLEGYAVIQYPWTGSPVRATGIFRREENGIIQAELSVPQQELGDHFSFPAEENSAEHIHTALALVNPAPLDTPAQTYIVNLLGTDGGIRATAALLVQPGRHLAGYLDEAWLFPGLDNFAGSVSVSSPLGAGVLALRQNQDTFSAISTDGGPILGPFSVSDPILQDEEPNDNFAQASFISGTAIISGAIGAAADADTFWFSGNAGDIVSVVCDTQGTGSYLDSYLEIFDSNFVLIARNDQNGLAPQLYPVNDSFIQMVLPQDDIYYIRVSDYFGDGGYTYTYTLHVKLP
jgi:hypothetical protein